MCTCFIIFELRQNASTFTKININLLKKNIYLDYNIEYKGVLKHGLKRKDY